MKRLILVTAMLVSLLLFPTVAFAHHVGAAEDSMPADQWLYVDSVAHGASADGRMDVGTVPGDGAGSESMAGDTNWTVAGQANMSTP